MRSLILVALLALAVPALASPYFPLVPGAIWTLADDDPVAAMTLTMAGEVIFHEMACYPRYETIDGELVGVTYWSVDGDGRALLHGLVYLQGEGAEFFFDPPAIYLDPDLACGEYTERPVHVYQAFEYGNEWQGEFAVRVTCLSRDPVTTPLGTYAAVTVDPAWIDSPLDSPWRYGHDGIFSFGFGVGPVRIASHADPTELVLVDLDNLVPTATPSAAGSQLALRAAPNPFNPTTTLHFEMAVAGAARLEVFDLAGRRLAVLHDGELPAGRHEFAWQPRELGSGVYLARVTTSAGSGSSRLTLVE